MYRRRQNLFYYLTVFFDALNVGNFQSGIFHRKPFQLPYDSASDERLAVSVHCVRTHTFILHHYNAVARK